MARLPIVAVVAVGRSLDRHTSLDQIEHVDMLLIEVRLKYWNRLESAEGWASPWVELRV